MLMSFDERMLNGMGVLSGDRRQRQFCRRHRSAGHVAIGRKPFRGTARSPAGDPAIRPHYPLSQAHRRRAAFLRADRAAASGHDKIEQDADIGLTQGLPHELTIALHKN